jgi:hypothetical protein
MLKFGWILLFILKLYSERDVMAGIATTSRRAKGWENFSVGQEVSVDQAAHRELKLSDEGKKIVVVAGIRITIIDWLDYETCNLEEPIFLYNFPNGRCVREDFGYGYVLCLVENGEVVPGTLLKG